MLHGFGDNPLASSIPFHSGTRGLRLRRLPAPKWLWASHFMVTGGDHER